jgi:crotonobetainyl-CoA:carnitine CoA-transferase CaiB-like acyl-CoA transferase
LCLQPDRYWPKVCKALGREELIDHPKFNTFEGRAKNRMELFEIFDRAFMAKPLEEWKPLFMDIPSAPIQNLLEVINDPQARQNNFFVPLDHPEYGKIEVVGPPVKFSKTPASVRTAAPEFSQHTEEVLLETGYTWDEITQFGQDGVIA